MIKILKLPRVREIPGRITGDVLHAAAGLALKESLISGYWSPCRARDWKKSFVPTLAKKGAFSCFGEQVPH